MILTEYSFELISLNNFVHLLGHHLNYSLHLLLEALSENFGVEVWLQEISGLRLVDVLQLEGQETVQDSLVV